MSIGRRNVHRLQLALFGFLAIHAHPDQGFKHLPEFGKREDFKAKLWENHGKIIEDINHGDMFFLDIGI